MDLKQSVDKCHALERELTRYKDSFGDISEDGEGMVDLALEVGRREEELKAFKIKHEGLEMVLLSLSDNCKWVLNSCSFHLCRLKKCSRTSLRLLVLLGLNWKNKLLTKSLI